MMEHRNFLIFLMSRRVKLHKGGAIVALVANVEIYTSTFKSNTAENVNENVSGSIKFEPIGRCFAYNFSGICGITNV
jgi:hypothetical protein